MEAWDFNDDPFVDGQCDSKVYIATKLSQKLKICDNNHDDHGQSSVEDDRDELLSVEHNKILYTTEQTFLRINFVQLQKHL